jgi:hypothetical protein
MRGLDSNKPLFKSFNEGELSCFLEEMRSKTKDFFLGIRDEYINIYYMGGSILKISGFGNKTGKYKIEFNRKYIIDSDESIPKNGDEDIHKWKIAMPILKSYIKSYQCGNNPYKKKKKEKIAQQDILINNNFCPNSEYFITDMEYSSPGIGYGRFDYIAIKKGKDSNGKHRLALIELKSGIESFSTTTKNNKGHLSYGSGIVGHALNFSRFIFGVKTNNSMKRELIGKTGLETLQYLQKETINILRNKSELGLLDTETNKIFNKLEQKDINIDEKSIETLLICVSCEDEEKAKKTIRRYLGYEDSATSNVMSLKENGEISEDFKLKCLVTKNNSIDCLREEQFNDLKI